MLRSSRSGRQGVMIPPRHKVCGQLSGHFSCPLPPHSSLLWESFSLSGQLCLWSVIGWPPRVRHQEECSMALPFTT